MGRFLQTDPIGYEDDLNLYAYVANSPQNSRDPTGMDRCPGVPNCWRADNYDAARAPQSTAAASEAALAVVIENRGALNVRDREDAIATNEQLSVVRPGADGTLQLDRVLNATADRTGDTDTTTGRTDMSQVVLVAHGHQNDAQGTIAPGLNDDQPLVTYGVANAVQQRGRVGVLEMVGGRYQYRLVVGRADEAASVSEEGEADVIQQRLNIMQNRIQGQ